MSETLRTNDVEVLIDGPSGTPTLLMVHGWPDTHEVWDHQVDALADRYRCARFTLPGYQVDDHREARTLEDLVDVIADVADAISPTAPVILVLHDWGCVFGYAYALLAPDRVRALVMFDVGDANAPAMEAELSRWHRFLRDSYQGILAAAWRRGGRVGDGITRAMASAIAPHADRTRVHAGMNYPYQVVRDRHDDVVLGEWIAHPTFFLYGTEKPFPFHSGSWERRLRATPGCRVAAIEAGHWLMRDRADEVNARLCDWLLELQAPGADTFRPADDPREMV